MYAFLGLYLFHFPLPLTELIFFSELYIPVIPKLELHLNSPIGLLNQNRHINIQFSHLLPFLYLIFRFIYISLLYFKQLILFRIYYSMTNTFKHSFLWIIKCNCTYSDILSLTHNPNLYFSIFFNFIFSSIQFSSLIKLILTSSSFTSSNISDIS